MLKPALQDIFRKLAIFRKSFSLELAVKTISLNLQDLKILTEHSLLQPNGKDRFRMHDVIHAFALDKLREYPDQMVHLYDQFSQEYLLLIAQLGTKMKTSFLRDVLDEIDQESDNIRLAWDWAMRKRWYESMTEALFGLMRYYQLQGRRRDIAQVCLETLNSIEELGIDHKSIRLWARLKTWRAFILTREVCQEEDLQKVFSLCESILSELAKSKWEHIDTRWEQGFVYEVFGDALFDNNIEKAHSLYLKSLSRYRLVGDPWEQANMLFDISIVQERKGSIQAQRETLEEALALAGEGSDPLLMYKVNHYLACTYLMTNQLREGSNLIDKAVDAYQQFGSQDTLQGMIWEYMVMQMWSGAYEDAIHSMERMFALGEPSPIALLSQAMMLNNLGQYEQASRCWAEVEGNAVYEIGMFIPGCQLLLQGEYEQALPLILTSVDNVRYTPDRRVGGMLQAFLSVVQYRLNDFSTARETLLEAIQWSLVENNTFGVGHSLAVAALFLLEVGSPESAAAIFESASRHPTVSNSVFLDDLVGTQVRELGESLPTDLFQNVQEFGCHWDQGDALGTLLGFIETEPDLKVGMRKFAQHVSKMLEKPIQDVLPNVEMPV